jgi:hypothetical protein
LFSHSNAFGRKRKGINQNFKLGIAGRGKLIQEFGQQGLESETELRGSEWPRELLQGRAKACNCQRARQLVTGRTWEESHMDNQRTDI